MYVFKDADGGVLYVGKALSIRKRVASHFSGPHRGGLEFIDQVASIDFLVTEKHLSRDDAYMLTSVAADLAITQVVDGTKGVHASIAKSIFVGH